MPTKYFKIKSKQDKFNEALEKQRVQEIVENLDLFVNIFRKFQINANDRSSLWECDITKKHVAF